MKQADLNRAVARATGESVATVTRLGFLLDDVHDPEADDGQIIDWDQLENGRPEYDAGSIPHAPVIA